MPKDVPPATPTAQASDIESSGSSDEGGLKNLVILPPSKKRGGSPGRRFQKMSFRVFCWTEFLTRFWSDFCVKKEVHKETKIVKKRSGNRFFSGLPFFVGFGTHLGPPTHRNHHFNDVK